MQINVDPWCILLASRYQANRSPVTPPIRQGAQAHPALVTRDRLTETLRRAAKLSSLERTGAVIAGPSVRWRESVLKDLDAGNVFTQPKHMGTAYEVLLALLNLEARVPPTTPTIFLPSDHVVSDEDVITRSLENMLEWISNDPRPVYLLGAVPEGPHDQLGYIIPWHDARQIPTGVYEFVEKPDVRQARRLINGGGLWNTFIFGGTIDSMIALFRPRFDPTIAALCRALRTQAVDGAEVSAIEAIYDHLDPLDFSRDLLARQPDSLNVLRMPRCGWWPLKSPKRVSHRL